MAFKLFNPCRSCCDSPTCLDIPSNLCLTIKSAIHNSGLIGTQFRGRSTYNSSNTSCEWNFIGDLYDDYECNGCGDKKCLLCRSQISTWAYTGLGCLYSPNYPFEPLMEGVDGAYYGLEGYTNYNCSNEFLRIKLTLSKYYNFFDIISLFFATDNIGNVYGQQWPYGHGGVSSCGNKSYSLSDIISYFNCSPFEISGVIPIAFSSGNYYGYYDYITFDIKESVCNTNVPCCRSVSGVLQLNDFNMNKIEDLIYNSSGNYVGNHVSVSCSTTYPSGNIWYYNYGNGNYISAGPYSSYNILDSIKCSGNYCNTIGNNCEPVLFQVEYLTDNGVDNGIITSPYSSGFVQTSLCENQWPRTLNATLICVSGLNICLTGPSGPDYNMATGSFPVKCWEQLDFELNFIGSYSLYTDNSKHYLYYPNPDDPHNTCVMPQENYIKTDFYGYLGSVTVPDTSSSIYGSGRVDYFNEFDCNASAVGCPSGTLYLGLIYNCTQWGYFIACNNITYQNSGCYYYGATPFIRKTNFCQLTEAIRPSGYDPNIPMTSFSMISNPYNFIKLFNVDSCEPVYLHSDFKIENNWNGLRGLTSVCSSEPIYMYPQNYIPNKPGNCMFKGIYSLDITE